MAYNPYNHQDDGNLPMVTIPLAQYTDMVKQIQMLQDQQTIDKLTGELDAAKEENSRLLCRVYSAEDKLKEATRNESV